MLCSRGQIQEKIVLQKREYVRLIHKNSGVERVVPWRLLGTAVVPCWANFQVGGPQIIVPEPFEEWCFGLRSRVKLGSPCIWRLNTYKRRNNFRHMMNHEVYSQVINIALLLGFRSSPLSLIFGKTAQCHLVGPPGPIAPYSAGTGSTQIGHVTYQNKAAHLSIP